MDLLSFHALCESVLRVRAATKTEDAWTAIRAAQGDAKGMKEWIASRWKADDEPDTKDLNALLGAIKPDALK